MKLFRITIIIIGISILGGIVRGYQTSETRYFVLLPLEPKREITVATYYKNNKNKYKNLVQKESSFNVESGLTFGLSTLSCLSILVGVFGNKIDRKKN